MAAGVLASAACRSGDSDSQKQVLVLKKQGPDDSHYCHFIRVLLEYLINVLNGIVIRNVLTINKSIIDYSLLLIVLYVIKIVIRLLHREAFMMVMNIIDKVIKRSTIFIILLPY